MIFMVISVLKDGGNWDFIGNMFNIKGPSFKRIITKFILLISDYVYANWVINMKILIKWKLR